MFLKNLHLSILLLLVLISSRSYEQSVTADNKNISFQEATTFSPQNVVGDLRSLLQQLTATSDNDYFKFHCQSIIDVMDAKPDLTSTDTTLLRNIYTSFSSSSVTFNAGKLSTYTDRKRPFIISWVSPSDGMVSLAWLVLPENWDPANTYPLYVRLHGLYEPYSNPIEYMSLYLTPNSVLDMSFNDGYCLLPWGRGNTWYLDQGGTDIWESIAALEDLVHIDLARKYLVGFSMGGFGTWQLGQERPDTWAALGIYAGALWYDGNSLTVNAADRLRNVPVYIVCGKQDGLLPYNEQAFLLLQNTGSSNIFFTTFTGGHDSRTENWENMYQWIKGFTNKGQGTGFQNNSITDSEEHVTVFPNPFSDRFRIVYSTDRPGRITLQIFNVRGEMIREFFSEASDAGMQQLELESGNLPEGSFCLRIISDYKVLNCRMLCVKY